MKFFKKCCSYEWQASPIWECLPEIENFCWCLSLKLGVFIIALCALAETALALALTFTRLGWRCKYVSEWVQIIGYFFVPVSMIVIISSIAILCLQRRRPKCRITGVADIFMWVVFLTHIIMFVILLTVGIKGAVGGCQFPFLWSGIFVISCVVWFYFLSVVNSFRKDAED